MELPYWGRVRDACTCPKSAEVAPSTVRAATATITCLRDHLRPITSLSTHPEESRGLQSAYDFGAFQIGRDRNRLGFSSRQGFQLESDTQRAAEKCSRVAMVRLATGIAALIMLGSLLFLPSFAPYLLRAEHWTADWRTALLAARPATRDTRIAIVLIDDDTLKDYASSPIDRSLLARIVKSIDESGAKVIGLDILFLKKTDADKDQSLLDTLAAARSNIILGALDERGDLQSFQKEFQHIYLDKAGRPAGYLNLHHDRDDVVRFMAAPANNPTYPKSFARLLAEAGGVTILSDASRPVPWLAKPEGGSDTFLKMRAQDLLANPDLAIKLKGRLVLVGGDFPLRDRHRVPLTVRDGEALPGVIIHAQILAAMLDPQRDIAELGLEAARGVLFTVAILGFAIGWRLWQSNVINYLGAGFATVVLLGLDAFCFKELRLLLPFTLALVAWVAGLTAGRSLHFDFSKSLFRRS